ncbi:hypothetical protein ACQ4PT_031348 [Festuca glaucescens]
MAYHPHPNRRSRTVRAPSWSESTGDDRRRRRRGRGVEAAGPLGERVRAPGAASPLPEGRPLLVLGGGPAQQERPSPPLQPRPPVRARSHPQRPPICESQVILQYIEETPFFSGSGSTCTLLPADPHERAVARFWAAYVDDEIGAPWDKAFRSRTEEERAAWMGKVAAVVPGLERGLRECTDGGRKGCFFGGAGVGFVDVVLGGVVPYVHANEVISGERLFDGEKTPMLAAWLERFGELEVARAVLPDVDRVVGYVRMIHAKNAAKGAE